MPGTLDQKKEKASNDAEGVEILQTLIAQWREPGLHLVRPRQVVPDLTNRDGTGVGVELVHFVALSMREKGFKKRRGTEGHDIPVVTREPPHSAFHGEALTAWREKVAEDEGFPPVRIDSEQEMFTSLGNGHFFQALNLYDCGCFAINDKGEYSVGKDVDLAEAISTGVPSIVLIPTTPRPVRAKISELLNTKREFLWTMHDDGTVDMSAQESTAHVTQFECMSKYLDSQQVNSLVRTRLGVHDSKRIIG